MAEKTYPLLKPALAVTGILMVLAAVMFLKETLEPNLLWILIAIAILLPFGALMRSRTIEPEHVDLERHTHQELEGTLKTLDAALKKGEITKERHAAAAARIRSAMEKKD